VITALLDDAHDLGNGLGRLGKVAAGRFCGAAALAVEAVGFLGISAHGFRRHVGGHHAVAQARQNTRFQQLAGHGAGVVATVAEHMVGADETVMAAPPVGAATAAAKHEAG